MANLCNSLVATMLYWTVPNAAVTDYYMAVIKCSLCPVVVVDAALKAGHEMAAHS
jgi:hypothetical protein